MYCFYLKRLHNLQNDLRLNLNTKTLKYNRVSTKAPSSGVILIKRKIDILYIRY